jgi:hypothetical protein
VHLYATPDGGWRVYHAGKFGGWDLNTSRYRLWTIFRRRCASATAPVKEHDRAHRQQCPDCLESEAENVLMDAASHREDGNEATALELEAEAEELRSRAATIRGR